MALTSNYPPPPQITNSLFRFDAREAQLRDPHKHYSTREILFWWMFTVVLSNAHTMYCLLNSQATLSSQKRTSLDDFLRELRNQLVPSCELVSIRVPSKFRKGHMVKPDAHCSVCRSKLGRSLNFFKLLSSKCHTRCLRCRQWMHPECQYFNHRHVSPAVPTIRRKTIAIPSTTSLPSLPYEGGNTAAIEEEEEEEEEEKNLSNFEDLTDCDYESLDEYEEEIEYEYEMEF